MSEIRRPRIIERRVIRSVIQVDDHVERQRLSVEQSRTTLHTHMHKHTSEAGYMYLLNISLCTCLDTGTVSRYRSETFEDTLVCVGLRRIVTVAFLRRVQTFLLTYLLTY